MRILEITAIPPKIYASPAEDLKWQDRLKGALSWVAHLGDQSAVEKILMSEPFPRQLPITKLNAYGLDGQLHTTPLGTCWYQENKESGVSSQDNTDYELTVEGETIKGDLLGDLTACSMNNNAINYWEVPDYWLNGHTRQANKYNPLNAVALGFINTINSALYSGSIAFTPPAPVYNNKARYCQSCNITVFNPCSGASLTKNIFDLLPNNADPSATTYNLSWAMGADIRPSGCPIFSWTYNDGGSNQLTNLNQAIKGGPWRKIPLSANGLNGSYFQHLQQRDTSATMVVGAMATMGAAVGGGLTGAYQAANDPDKQWLFNQGNGIGQQNLNKAMVKGFNKGMNLSGLGLTALGGFAVATYQQIIQQQMLAAKGVCATYPQFTGSSDFAQDVQGNKFRYCISTYRGEDLMNYDAFLEKYGYNVGNMIIGTQHFWAREQFVYIKINDMTISSAKAGKALKDEVISQLQAGVRIWRHRPNIAAMNPGGNRTVPTDCPVQ